MKLPYIEPALTLLEPTDVQLDLEIEKFSSAVRHLDPSEFVRIQAEHDTSVEFKKRAKN